MPLHSHCLEVQTAYICGSHHVTLSGNVILYIIIISGGMVAVGTFLAVTAGTNKDE